MFLKEVEQAGNHCILFFLGIPKGISADVDVQATGIRLVRTVAHPNCTTHHILPRHIPAVIGQAHGVRDQLEAVRQRTVVLTVEILVVSVGNLQETIGVFLVLSL